LPWYVVGLVIALVAFYAGFATCLAETKAVRAMRPWPFHKGILAVRLRSSFAEPFGDVRSDVTRGIEYRVLSATECIFVEEGWQSVLSWTPSASPFRLKGCALWQPGGIEVSGRISLGSCIAIPAIALWLSGCGLLGMSQAPAFSALFVVLGLGLPLFGAWYSLPKEIATFRAAWAELESELRARGGLTTR